MWSFERRGGASALSAQQRVLFPVASGSDAAARQLTRALATGVCTGVALLASDDRRACRTVRAALQDACARNPLLSRAHFAVVVETGATIRWSAELLLESVNHLLESLQLEKLDLLLLSAQSLVLPDDTGAHENKRAVLRLWTAALELQQRGLAAQLGVSGFTVQQTEFILMAHPQNPPVATVVDVSFQSPATGDEAPEGYAGTPSVCLPLASMVAFAHGRTMDVVVRFPVRGLDALPLSSRDHWKRLVHTIAHKHREQSFQVAVTHEADQEPCQTLTRTMSDTPALQSPVQIALRYLLQKGLVVIPTPSSAESGSDAPFDDDECHEIFYTLLHPFTALAPSYSANKLYSSILQPEVMDAIDQTLPLMVVVDHKQRVMK